jgi:hypothetical protein
MRAAEVYRQTRKKPDLFWNTYVCRPPAALVVSALADTKATPNQVTLLSFVVGGISALMLLVWPGHVGLVAAVLVYELSYVLDCADGMLARWRGTASKSGHLLDFLMDELKAFLILAAVAVRLYLEHSDTRFLLLGLGGLVALASGIALTTFLRRPEIAPAPADMPPSRPPSLVRRVLRLPERLAKLVIHYPSYILIAALIGRIELYFYPYILVNALYMLRALGSVAFRFGRSTGAP